MTSIFRRPGRRPVPASSTRHATREGRTHRALFAVMGPAQLGDPNEAPARPAPPDTTLCRGCGRSWAEHRIVRDVFSPYSICPSQPQLS